MLRIMLSHGIQHGDGGTRRLSPTIERRCNAASKGLLLIIQQQHLVDDRHHRLASNGEQLLSDGSANKVSMRCAATKNNTKANDNGGLVRLRNGSNRTLHHDGHLKGTGNAQHLYLNSRGAFLKLFQAICKQRRGKFLVVGSGNNHNALMAPMGLNFAGKFRRHG